MTEAAKLVGEYFGMKVYADERMAADEFVITDIPPQPFPAGRVELKEGGVFRYRLMTREEFNREFPPYKPSQE